jgi:hypothetical protein
MDRRQRLATVPEDDLVGPAAIRAKARRQQDGGYPARP